MFLASKKGRKATKTAVKVGAGLGIAIGVSIVAKLIYDKYFKVEYIEDVAHVPEVLAEDVAAVSMENIEYIAQDISLEEAEKITAFQLQLNEQFSELEKAREQTSYFENLVVSINSQIAAETSRINAIHDPLILAAKRNYDIMVRQEASTHEEWAILNNEMTDLQVKKTNLQTEADEVAKDFFKAVWRLPQIGLEMNGVQTDITRLEGWVYSAWNAYQTEVNNVRLTNTDYNNALAAKSQEEQVVLVSLKRQLPAAQSNLNSWTIAFKAAEIVVNELKVQLVALGES